MEPIIIKPFRKIAFGNLAMVSLTLFAGMFFPILTLWTEPMVVICTLLFWGLPFFILAYYLHWLHPCILSTYIFEEDGFYIEKFNKRSEKIFYSSLKTIEYKKYDEIRKRGDNNPLFWRVYHRTRLIAYIYEKNKKVIDINHLYPDAYVAFAWFNHLGLIKTDNEDKEILEQIEKELKFSTN